MSIFKRHTITAALPYANGPVHIGHLAGCYLPADIYVRYLRANDKDVAFICGSDEHGVGISIKATQEGITPQELIDKYHPVIKQSFEDFGISFNIYSRTSHPNHYQVAQDFFRLYMRKMFFVKKTSQQFYDAEYDQFLADRYINGTCPNCGYEKAYGDQCENCGQSLDPQDLINPISVLSKKTPELKETEHYYLPLQNYEQWLNEWILGSHNDWKNNVFGQCKSWLNQGLHERAVTRDLTWGVPVPLDDAIGKVLYVWFDAPIGYISATKEWADANGKDWEDYWKSPDTRLLHFIGKDNIVFHCIIFPAMLHAHGEYILPDNVPANEFLNIEGEKISTSRNWAVWLHEYLLDFPNRQDTLRYVLCANAPETKDNDFTWKDFQAKNNNELVAVYGNLVNRVNVLTHNYYQGTIPTPNQYEEIDNELISVLNQAPEKVTICLEGFRFREGLQEVMNLARSANKYLTDTEPWKLQKTNPERAKTVLFLATQVLGSLAILSEPIMPFSAKVLQSALHIEDAGWREAGSEKLVKSNQIFDKLPLLFTQVSDDEIAIQTQKLEEKRKVMELINNPIKEEVIKTEEVPAFNHIPLKETITIDDFSKLDLRVGTILEAKKVEKADKLLQLTIDMGFETRTVLSGIALQFKPEDIIGKQIVIVANLTPRVMRGIESKGMILMADASNGGLVMISPVETAPAGSEVR